MKYGLVCQDNRSFDIYCIFNTNESRLMLRHNIPFRPYKIYIKISLCPEITVQTRKIVDSKVCEENAAKPDDGKDGHTLSPPASYVSRMQKNCIYKPGDKRPRLFGVPAPVKAPGVMRPNGTRHDSDGEKNKTKSDALIN